MTDDTQMGNDLSYLQNEPYTKMTKDDETSNVQQQRDINTTQPDGKSGEDENTRELDPNNDTVEVDAAFSDIENYVENLNEQNTKQGSSLTEDNTTERLTTYSKTCQKELEKNEQMMCNQNGLDNKGENNQSQEKKDSISTDETNANPLKIVNKNLRKFKLKFKRGEKFDIFMSGKMLFKDVAEFTQEMSTEETEDLKLMSSEKFGFTVDFSQIKERDLSYAKPSVHVATTSQKTSESIVFKRDSDKKYVCSECGKKFIEKHGLILHMRSHTGERPYKCKFCDKAYQHGSHLKDHVLSHHASGHRPHICEICGKGFPIAARLRSHQRIHKETTPCKCEDCGKTFAREELLRQHIAYKKKGYDIICELCGHKFRQNVLLKKHMLMKHGEPQFHCTHCDKKFFKERNYTVHVNNHLGIHKYTCVCCGLAFSCQGALTRHYKRKAGVFGKGKSKSKRNRVKTETNPVLKEERVEEDMEINDLWNME